MGGKSKEPQKLTQEQVLALYRASPEAILSLDESAVEDIWHLSQLGRRSIIL